MLVAGRGLQQTSTHFTVSFLNTAFTIFCLPKAKKQARQQEVFLEKTTEERNTAFFISFLSNMTKDTIGIFGAGGEIGGNILRVNASRAEQGEHLDISHLVDGFHTRDSMIHALRNNPMRGAVGIVEAHGKSGIRINGLTMEFIHGSEIPAWDALGVTDVLECSGQRVQVPLAQEHVSIGKAQKVLVTAPTKGEGAQTVIVGFNEHAYDTEGPDVITNESCTTKSAIHITNALRGAFGVRALSLATVHAETGAEKRQLIEQSGHAEDIRALNFRPEPTGSQGALTKLFPQVTVDAKAYRVPTPDGSISDMTFKLSSNTNETAVREILEQAVQKNIWQMVQEIRASSDLLGNMHDSVVDASSLRVLDENMVRIRAGYDNAFAPARASLDAMRHVRSRHGR